MTIRTLSIAFCLTAFGCSSALGTGTDAAAGAGGGGTGGGAGTSAQAGTSGEAGTSGGAGTSGVAGTSGAAGTTGAGGAAGLPSCDSLGGSSGIGVGGVYTVGEDGRQPRETWTASVFVVSVDDCSTGVCGSMPTGKRIIVSDDAGRRFTLTTSSTALAPDFVTVNETLMLRVVFRQASSSVATYDFFSTILLRAGTPVMFDVSDGSMLLDYGITVGSSGYLCKQTCYTISGTTVTYGGETRTVPSGGVHFGKLWFSGAYFDLLRGPCDSLSHQEHMIGFIDR